MRIQEKKFQNVSYANAGFTEHKFLVGSYMPATVENQTPNLAITRKRKKYAYVAIAALTVAAAVTYIISLSYDGRNSAWLVVSRSLLVAVFVIFLAFGFMTWRNAQIQPRRMEAIRYVVQGYRAGPISQTRSVKAVEPSIETQFWRPDYIQSDASTPDDRICSVCLCSVQSDHKSHQSSTPDIGSGQAACCNSWFHRYCVLQYWQSNDGNVVCPNCRYDRTPLPVEH